MRLQKRRSVPVITVGVLLILAGVIGFLVSKLMHPVGVVFLDPEVREYVPPGGAKLPGSVVNQVIEAAVPQLKKSVKVPIVLYHYIEYNRDSNDTFRMKLTVTPFWFEKQLQDLKANGYVAIDYRDLLAAMQGKGILPDRPVLLTFDDGYRDFYTDALPLLRKYGTKATLFVISGFLDQPNYLYRSQLLDITTNSSDLIIGAHTVHHAALTAQNPQEVWSEIHGSKVTLEAITGRKVRDFAYPYGLFNDDVIDAVKKAGFETATSTIFGTVAGPQNVFMLPRVRVGNFAGALFLARLH